MRFPSPIRFLADRRGNVAMMYALMLPVLLFGAGFAVDYTHAMQVQTKLDAAADAAVLAALTPAMMEQTDATAQTAATNLFNAMANAQTSLIAADTQVTVNVCKPTACTPGQRTVTVSYTAANQNIFAGVLGYTALQIAGSSTANAAISPNIDFYLLLDNSPSMALPATTDGLSLLQSMTTQQESGGCAFACHQGNTNPYSNPSNLSQVCTGPDPGHGTTNRGCSNKNNDIVGNLCVDGSKPTLAADMVSSGNVFCKTSIGQMDNYALARYEKIQLRIDELTSGVSTLMSTAQSTTAQSPQVPPPAYRFAANTVDSTYATGFTSLMGLTAYPNYVSAWNSAAANLQLMQVYLNNYACQTSSGNPCGTGTYSDDTETNLDSAMTAANSQMVTPGNGTNISGDKPQEVLFIVTDGVADFYYSSSCSGTTSSGGRCYEPINTSLCTTIKNRGIRIAVLYTTYFAVTNDGWYNSYVEPINVDPVNNSQIRTQLQACASTNLYAEVGLSDDLGQALTNLFTKARDSAHLTN